MPCWSSTEIFTVSLRTWFYVFNFHFLPRFFSLLDNALGLSVRDLGILTLLRKDAYWEALDVPSAPSTALCAVSRRLWGHLHKAVSAFSAWYTQEMGHLLLANRSKFTKERRSKFQFARQGCRGARVLVSVESCNKWKLIRVQDFPLIFFKEERSSNTVAEVWVKVKVAMKDLSW